MLGVSTVVLNPIVLCAFLYTHSKEEESSSGFFSPEQNEPKMILFCVLLLCDGQNRFRAQKIASQSSACWTAERSKHKGVRGAGVGWRTWSRSHTDQNLTRSNSLFTQRLSVNAPTVANTLESNVYSSFITESRGIFDMKSWIWCLLYICISAAHRFEMVEKRAQTPPTELQWF